MDRGRHSRCFSKNDINKLQFLVIIFYTMYVSVYAGHFPNTLPNKISVYVRLSSENVLPLNFPKPPEKCNCTWQESSCMIRNDQWH